MHRASSRVGGVVDAALELLLGDPFRQEIGGHEVVGDLDDAALAVGHAALQRVVAAQEVARARGGLALLATRTFALLSERMTVGPVGGAPRATRTSRAYATSSPALALAMASLSCEESTTRPIFLTLCMTAAPKQVSSMP